MAGETVVVPAEPTQKDNDDNFAAAFQQITEEDKAAVVAAEKPAPVATEAKPAEPAAAADAGGTDLPPTAEEKAAADAAAAAAAEAAKKTTPAAPEVKDEDILRRLGAMLGKEPPAQETQQPEPAVPAAPALSEEEATLIGAYVNDYPDIARAESLIRKQEYAAVVGYVFAEVARELQPMMQMLQTIAGRTHLGDLQAAVPDYAATREQVVEWAGKQPAYLKVAYEHVIKHGTVDEVADLIKRYKMENPLPVVNADGTPVTVAQATGAPPTASAARPAAPAPKSAPQPELSAAAKKAVAALAPVGSKRSGAVVTAPTDYDEAFALAAKEL